MRTLGSIALQGVAGLFTPIGLHQLSKINFTLSDHTYAYAISKLDRTKARLSNRELSSCQGLTYVVLVVHDRVERHVFALQVSLSGLHVVVAVVTLNEALKFTIHDGAMSKCTFLTWGDILQTGTFLLQTEEQEENRPHELSGE